MDSQTFVQILDKWQVLIGSILGGLFAVVGGSLVLLEGHHQAVRLRNQADARHREYDSATEQILLLLKEKTQEWILRVEEDKQQFEDFVRAETSDPSVQAPEFLSHTRAFQIVLDQLSSRNVDHTLMGNIVELIDQLDIYERDHKRFVEACPKNVISMGSAQRRLPLPSVDEPARSKYSQALETTIDATLSRLQTLESAINSALGISATSITPPSEHTLKTDTNANVSVLRSSRHAVEPRQLVRGRESRDP